MNKLLCFSVALLLLTACNTSTNKKEDLPDPLVTNRDTTVNPAQDFFHYADGGWFKAHPIPASERSNGIFRTIQDTINEQVKRICEESAKANDAAGSNKQKIGDFFNSGMDTLNIEKAGIVPLNAEFARIDSVTDIHSLLNSIAHLQTVGVDVLFSFHVGQDDKISDKYALFFWQGGIGLGVRDYYFDNDERTKNIRSEYVKHIQKMLALSGLDTTTSTSGAIAIMKLETELAAHSRKLEALRDPLKNYNKIPVGEFDKLTPGINWSSVLTGLGISNADTVIAGQPEFYSALSKTLKKFPLNDWKLYLRWNLVNTYAPYLNKAINDESFYFNSTVLNGVKERKPRWKSVVETTNGLLGEIIGQVYVNEYLPKGTKDKLLEIGNNIRSVYAEHIKKLDWMSDSTKIKALSKLSKIIMKVGYPDKWKDYTALTIGRNSYAANVMSAFSWHYKDMASKWGKPVDRTEWDMTPQTYNAYYNPSNNEIVVPACNIIVPGFEGRMPDDAVLYGIIGGSTFGHEITHGFDDQGSQYDENGNLQNWWTTEDREKFLQKTKLIVEQFNKYTMLDSLHLNGDATQGENIADLGGVVMGYEAFKKTDQYKSNVTIAGLTPDQRYFLAYGYAWMVNSTPESIARQVRIDVHAPAQYRVNGPLSNIPEFYKTFNIQSGSVMYQPDSLRVVIW
jgi:putative endopeptidase